MRERGEDTKRETQSSTVDCTGATPLTLARSPLDSVRSDTRDKDKNAGDTRAHKKHSETNRHNSHRT